MKIHLCILVWCVAGSGLVAGQDLAAARKAARKQALELEGSVRSVSRGLWEMAETALRERRSAKLLADLLEKEGFSLRRGVAGMPTAFVAQFGSGSPVIGVLAEYDALPGVGNQPVPRRQKRADGVTAGHGCGHNLFGAASVLGAVALKRTMAARGIKGTLRLYGCPAEETVVGKVYMAREGLFDDLDASIVWHPSTRTRVSNDPARALNNFEIEYFGQAAHASTDPWNGRSALDAVEMLNFGVNLMREHVRPEARIHYVIVDGGEAPNVVPEYAKVWYYVRGLDRKMVQAYYDRILKIAEGAALGTGTTHKVTLITGVHDILLNRPLQERLQETLETVGAPSFSAEEQAFARQLQRNCGKPEVGFRTDVQPLPEAPERPKGGSSDVAEVSWITPTVQFNVTTAAFDVPWHSWATTACHGTEAGVKGAVVATQVIAMLGSDLFLDADLRQRARAFFKQKTVGRPYVSPLPAGQKVRLPAR